MTIFAARYSVPMTAVMILSTPSAATVTETTVASVAMSGASVTSDGRADSASANSAKMDPYIAVSFARAAASARPATGAGRAYR